MSDRERLLALLADFGIVPVTRENPTEGNAVLIVAQQGEAQGYNGFFCEFGFNDDESFKDVGVWE